MTSGLAAEGANWGPRHPRGTLQGLGPCRPPWHVSPHALGAGRGLVLSSGCAGLDLKCGRPPPGPKLAGLQPKAGHRGGASWSLSMGMSRARSVVLRVSTLVAPWCLLGAAATGQKGWGGVGGEGQAPWGTMLPAPGAFPSPIGPKAGQLFRVERPLAPAAVCLLSQEHLLSTCFMQWAGSRHCWGPGSGQLSPAHTAPRCQ